MDIDDFVEHQFESEVQTEHDNELSNGLSLRGKFETVSVTENFISEDNLKTASSLNEDALRMSDSFRDIADKVDTMQTKLDAIDKHLKKSISNDSNIKEQTINSKTIDKTSKKYRRRSSLKNKNKNNKNKQSMGKIDTIEEI